MNFAQAIEQTGKTWRTQALGQHAPVTLDVLLQRAATLVLHDHTPSRWRGKIQHTHNVRVIDRKRLPFIEEALHAKAERVEILD